MALSPTKAPGGHTSYLRMMLFVSAVILFGWSPQSIGDESGFVESQDVGPQQLVKLATEELANGIILRRETDISVWGLHRASIFPGPCWKCVPDPHSASRSHPSIPKPGSDHRGALHAAGLCCWLALRSLVGRAGAAPRPGFRQRRQIHHRYLEAPTRTGIPRS